MTEERRLARSIVSIVGPHHVINEPDLLIDGLTPRLVVRPGSAEEVLACMKVCAELGAAVVPAGLMTWLECGNPMERVDVVLSLDRMTRVLDYSPPDLTATVEAGVTLSSLNEVTALERQWLPLDPPGFRHATLGAVVACNSSGSLRLGSGTPRDYVIGLKLVHADGTESKSGGKVVKNVAGYDMNKLYAGSFGTLAVLTELTFKLRPQTQRSATLLITSRYRGPLFQVAKRVLASELQPASVVLTRRLFDSSGSGWPSDALLIRFNDTEAAVDHQVQQVNQAMDENHTSTLLSEDRAANAWALVADFDAGTTRVKLSVPLMAVPAQFEKALLAHLDCVATADIGTGIIRIAFDAEGLAAVDQLRRLRASAAAANGTLVIEKAPLEVRREAGVWGDAGSTATLMRSIKKSFDPRALLNPGKFAWD